MLILATTKTTMTMTTTAAAAKMTTSNVTLSSTLKSMIRRRVWNIRPISCWTIGDDCTRSGNNDNDSNNNINNRDDERNSAHSPNQKIRPFHTRRVDGMIFRPTVLVRSAASASFLPPSCTMTLGGTVRYKSSTRLKRTSSKSFRRLSPVNDSKRDDHVDEDDDDTENHTDDDDDNDDKYDEDDDDDDLDDTDMGISSQPWKTLLDAPSRAAWRVTDPHSKGMSLVRESMEEILKYGNRTPKQLKRAHRKVLEIQTTLEECRERERRKLVNGKYYRVGSASGGKDSNRNEETTILPVFYGHDETLATLKFRTIPNFAITRRVLKECQSLVDYMKPTRIVDFGIGCGSASAAALDVFGESIEWIHGIDPALPMRECSQRLLEGIVEKDQDATHPRSPRITYSTGLSPSSTSDTMNGEGSFDLALMAYTATDLPDIGSALAAAAMLFEKLKPDGILVLIEPGTPDGFNSIRAIRNMLLDCCPPDDPDFEWAERCHIIAPCTHNGPCPMVRHKKEFMKKQKLAYDLPQDQEDDMKKEILRQKPNVEDSNPFIMEEGGDSVESSTNFGNASEFGAFHSSFCSFVHTLPGSDSRKGEKFSYLVVQKRIYGQDSDITTTTTTMSTMTPPSSSSSFGREEDNLSHLLAKAQSAAVRRDAREVEEVFQYVQNLESRYLESEDDDLGLELLKGDSKRSSMGRIIRAPIKKKGHVYIDYCTSPGRIIRSRVAKSSSSIAPGLWNAARKSRWGGFWPDTMDKK